MSKDNTAAAAVAELDSVLSQIKTAASKKTAAEMHEQGGGDKGSATSLTSSTPAADDGDMQHAEGERARENISDVKDQQPLTHEGQGAPAESPQFNNAPDETGDITETDADAEEGKQMQHPDKQYGATTSHPARTDNSKIAELLKIAEEYSDDKGGEEKPKENGEGGEAPPAEGEGGGEAPPAPPEGEAPPVEGEMPPEGGIPMDPTMPAADPSEEELMAIEQLLGGVPPKMAAAVPDLPLDDEGLQKLASENPDAFNDYVEKVAGVYSDEVENGFRFAANVHAALAQAKTAADGDVDAETKAEIENLQKQAMADAGNVAEVVEGIEEGGAPVEGAEDPLAGGETPLEDEVALGGGEGGDAASEAEALLAALSQGGAGDEALMKAAKAVGFDENRAKAALAKSREA